jgi:hypothetical protein
MVVLSQDFFRRHGRILVAAPGLFTEGLVFVQK